MQNANPEATYYFRNFDDPRNRLNVWQVQRRSGRLCRCSCCCILIVVWWCIAGSHLQFSLPLESDHVFNSAPAGKI